MSKNKSIVIAFAWNGGVYKNSQWQKVKLAAFATSFLMELATTADKPRAEAARRLCRGAKKEKPT